MRKILFFLLLACALNGFAKQVAVLQADGMGDVLSADQLKSLTDRMRDAAVQALQGNKDLIVLTTETVTKRLGGTESYIEQCSSDTACTVGFGKKAQADYVSKAFVGKLGGKLELKAELYNVSTEGLIGTLSESAKDFDELLAIVKKNAPGMFESIIKTPQQICDEKGKEWTWDNGECKSTTQMGREICESAGKRWIGGVCKSQEQLECEVVVGNTWTGNECKTKAQMDCENKLGRWENNACKTKAQIDKEDCEAIGNNYINGICKEPTFAAPPPQQAVAGGTNIFSANVKTMPGGATLQVNGGPGCKTPCTIQSYDKKVRITATLSDYKIADTTFTITMPGQLVNIKLEPKTYTVYFESQPSQALLTFNGETNFLCKKTPCREEFKKGSIRVRASLDLYDTKDTTISVSTDNQRVNINLHRNFGTMNIKTKGEGWRLMIDNKYSSFNDIKLPPGSYKVNLTHECYDDINFNANIRKATDEVFDLASKAVLKCGTLEVKSADVDWILSIAGTDYRSLEEVALLPGNYKAKLTHDLYEDIDFDVEVKKGGNTVFDISDKIVHRYGYLGIKSEDYKWQGSVQSSDGGAYGRSINLQSLDRITLLPGAYKVHLSHESSECYEDIDFDVEIKRGELSSFDISDKKKPTTGNLALYVKYKGRNQKEPVFIDGKEVGNTPFKQLIPVCSESVELGNDKERISLVNLRSSGVEYTRRLPTVRSTMLSLAIGTVGAVLLYNAYSQNSKASDYKDDYDKLSSSYPLEYDKVRKKAEDARSKASIFLISGGAVFGTAVGVYLWF